MEAQNVNTSKSRFNYLAKEAERKTFEARLIKAAEGKSHAERLVNAQATEEWLTFHAEHAKLEARYEFEKFKLEILDKEWLAEYLTMKSDAPIIRKQGA